MAKNATTKGDGYDLSLRVSNKGAVQLDGLRRFPVVLYADEWEAVLSRADAIRAWIKQNQAQLKTKADKKEAAGKTSI